MNPLCVWNIGAKCVMNKVKRCELHKWIYSVNENIFSTCACVMVFIQTGATKPLFPCKFQRDSFWMTNARLDLSIWGEKRGRRLFHLLCASWDDWKDTQKAISTTRDSHSISPKFKWPQLFIFWRCYSWIYGNHTWQSTKRKKNLDLRWSWTMQSMMSTHTQQTELEETVAPALSFSSSIKIDGERSAFGRGQS